MKPNFQDNSCIHHQPQPLPTAAEDTLPNIMDSELNSVTITYNKNGSKWSSAVAADFTMTPDCYMSSASDISIDNMYSNISYHLKQQQKGYSSDMDNSSNESKETEDNGAANPDYVPEARNKTFCRYSSCHIKRS